MQIILDFETWSPLPLDKVGSVKYARHPYTRPLCCAYKIDDQPTKLWTEEDDKFPPEFFGSNVQYVAHNAFFDLQIFNRFIKSTYLDQWLDTMALATRYGYPASLENVGAVLNLPVQKDPRGKYLVRRCCTPQKNPPTQGELEELYEYCIRDVDTTYEVLQHLPASSLASQEQKLWELTCLMNLRGLPVDRELAEKIIVYITAYAEELTKELPALTGGAVTKVTQLQRIRNWMASLGWPTDNLQAETVAQLLKNPDLPEEIHEVLTLRQMLGKSSTAKYQKILDYELHGRVHGSYMYYGAHTGRWAGRGIQIHNLPRAKTDDPEEAIRRFKNMEPIDDAVTLSKALIRPTLLAPKGKMWVVADYSSVENRVLAWMASDQSTLDLFSQGGDQYKDMASFLYQVPYDQVNKDQRWLGKIIILGCGFGMGGPTFQRVAEQFGATLSAYEAQEAVNAYRAKYPLVKKMWYRLADICKAAVMNPGKAYASNKCVVRVVRDRAGFLWLQLMLPSGRSLYYRDPYISEDRYGPVVRCHQWFLTYQKWMKQTLIPGTITENVVQATARDLLAHGMLRLEEKLPEVELILSVHDEAGGLADEDKAEELLPEFIKHMCHKPEWAEGLPLAAEGYVAKRYRKD